MEQFFNDFAIGVFTICVTVGGCYYVAEVLMPTWDEKAKQKSKKAGAADPMHHCTGCDKCRGRKEVYNRLETLEDFQ